MCVIETKIKTQVLEKQTEFLDEYNSKRSNVKAIEEAVKVSVQRNKYIFDATDTNKKKDFKKKWDEILWRESKKLYTFQEEQSYCGIIEHIKNRLNEIGRGELKIKISHAQKSLSVYIKHLWCCESESSNGRPKIKPVHCPVDRVVLDLIGWKGKPWTQVDSIDEHLEQINAIRKFLNRVGDTSTLSEWEVVNFEKGLRRRTGR